MPLGSQLSQRVHRGVCEGEGHTWTDHAHWSVWSSLMLVLCSHLSHLSEAAAGGGAAARRQAAAGGLRLS